MEKVKTSFPIAFCHIWRQVFIPNSEHIYHWNILYITLFCFSGERLQESNDDLATAVNAVTERWCTIIIWRQRTKLALETNNPYSATVNLLNVNNKYKISIGEICLKLSVKAIDQKHENINYLPSKNPFKFNSKGMRTMSLADVLVSL